MPYKGGGGNIITINKYLIILNDNRKTTYIFRYTLEHDQKSHFVYLILKVTSYNLSFLSNCELSIKKKI